MEEGVKRVMREEEKKWKKQVFGVDVWRGGGRRSAAGVNALAEER